MSFLTDPLLIGVLTALGLGLLIGAVRERQLSDPLAGVRTHALVAVLAVVAASFHMYVLLLVLAGVSGLVLISYQRGGERHPGMTGEVGLILTAVLGALALSQPALAAGLGVVTAAILHAKGGLHRFARELISEREVHDGLLLLAAALVVLPLIPDRSLGPFSVFNPAKLWTLVVLVMAVSALGHVALRSVGERWGLAVAGFFAGLVSSTAAIVGFGQKVRETPDLLRSAVAAALLANLASLALCVPILLAVAPNLLPALLPPLIAGGLVLLIGGLFGLRGKGSSSVWPASDKRMFRFAHALGLAAIIASVLFVAAAMNHWLGPQAALLTASLAALAELHAATATLGQLFDEQVLSVQQARWGLLGLLTMSASAKTVLAWISGGRSYGLRVGVGLLAMLAAALAALVWVPPLDDFQRDRREHSADRNDLRTAPSPAPLAGNRPA